MSEKVLAIVAGHEITEGELNQLIANYPPEQQIHLADPRAKAQLLDQLVSFYLFSKMAEEEKIYESEEYLTTIEKMKVELASHMAATKTIEAVTVEDDEVKAYYEANKEQFMEDEQVNAKHILVDTEEMAAKIAEEIAAGKSFEDAAKEYSTCPSKDRGGELGYFTKGQMVKEFEKAAFEGEVNTVIGPVTTQFGSHLILVTDKKEATVIPYEHVQGEIYKQLLQDKQRTAYSEKVAELTDKYGVEKKN